jgi:hypothetical protein
MSLGAFGTQFENLYAAELKGFDESGPGWKILVWYYLNRAFRRQFGLSYETSKRPVLIGRFWPGVIPTTRIWEAI